MKKKFLSALLLVAMLMTLVPSFVFAEGDNTEASDGQTESASTAPEAITPSYEWYTGATDGNYEIKTVNDLVGLTKMTRGAVEGVCDAAESFKDKTIKLANSITFGKNEYLYYHDGTNTVDYRGSTTIGNFSNKLSVAFAGTLDGQNHSIYGLKFHNQDPSKSPYMYLFNTISGTVKNLTLDGVTADVNNGDRFGFLALSLTGTATNCHVKNVTATVSVDSGENGYVSTAGAMFASISSATVSGCTAETVKITCYGKDNTDLVGALIGSAGGSAEARSTVESCSVSDITFDCTRKTKRTGGFVGHATYTDFLGCTATNVNIHVDSYFQTVGGFIGNASTGSVFKDCSVVGFKLSNNEGAQYPGSAGGFCAYTFTGIETPVIFENCDVSGLDMDVYADDVNKWCIGGFTGYLSGNTDTSGCDVSGTIDVSGLSDKILVSDFLASTEGREITMENDTVNVKITNENAALKDTVGNAVGNIGNVYYGNLQTIIDKTTDGGVVKLTNDVTISSPIIVSKKLTLNLNGYTIKNTKALWDDENKNWSLISVRGGELTITGEGNIHALAQDCYAVDVQGGKLIINGGSYLGNWSTVYVKEGEAIINGGYFDMTQLNNLGNKEHMINCYDESFSAGTATVTVLGGTFVGFNPSCNAAEGKHTVFTPNGYIGQVTDGVYTIVEGTNIVIDEGVAPTCTESGISEGSHCAVCGEILVAQEIVDALGHTEADAVIENEVSVGYNQTGTYDSVVYCSVCDEELIRQTLQSADALASKVGFVRYHHKTDTEEKYYITLIAGIDSLEYKEVGFIITVGNRTEKFVITTVYTSVEVNIDGVATVLSASEFATEEFAVQYIFWQAISFSNVGENTLTYQIYAEKLDGTIVYGQPKETQITHDDISNG